MKRQSLALIVVMTLFFSILLPADAALCSEVQKIDLGKDAPVKVPYAPGYRPTSAGPRTSDVFEPSQPYFWRKKKVLKSMLEDREIVVSVTDDDENDLKQLHIKGAGIADVPVKAARRIVVRYEKLKALAPDHFKEIRYHEPLKTLYIHGVAFKWHAIMHMHLHEKEAFQSDPENFSIYFNVVKGSFAGMKGKVYLEDVKPGLFAKDNQRRKTEISMTAFYESEKLPLPSILLRFGLETVMKVVAGRLRDYIESQYSTIDQATKE